MFAFPDCALTPITGLAPPAKGRTRDTRQGSCAHCCVHPATCRKRQCLRLASRGHFERESRTCGMSQIGEPGKRLWRYKRASSRSCMLRRPWLDSTLRSAPVPRSVPALARSGENSCPRVSNPQPDRYVHGTRSWRRTSRGKLPQDACNFFRLAPRSCRRSRCDSHSDLHTGWSSDGSTRGCAAGIRHRKGARFRAVRIASMACSKSTITSSPWS